MQVEGILEIFFTSIQITGFIFIMMLVIEYINVQTRGILLDNFTRSSWKPYLIAGILGAIPGCLGAFTVVTLYAHRKISIGAVISAMIATSGDEAFVMFAMFPGKAFQLTIIIFFIGIVAGYLSDKFLLPGDPTAKYFDHNLPLHAEDQCRCFQKDKLWDFLIHPSRYRLLLLMIVLFLTAGFLNGILFGNPAMWIRITIIISLAFSFFVVLTVPDHFLEEHLWDHIVKKHLLKIFLWTFGTLLAIHIVMVYIDIRSMLDQNMIVVIFIAVLTGIIPQSGPHLIFVSLFVNGVIPFSVLLASSISQDGHGMLPLLAESKKSFFTVKLVNVLMGLITGIGVYLAGY
jgi:hypothetical protein